MGSFLQRYNPTTDRHGLVRVAAATWCCAGLIVLSLGAGWLIERGGPVALLLATAGLPFGFAVHHFGLSRIVRRNVARIRARPERSCVFGFQPWRSYLLIAIMITMGITLRQTAIPKPWLAVPYTGMGLALLLSAVRYWRTPMMREGEGRTLPEG
jgi:hypothetical protein